MKFFTNVILPLAFVFHALAAPVVEDGAVEHKELEKRITLHFPRRNINCATNSFTPPQMTAAVDHALMLHRTGQTRGRGRYPHIFNNRERLRLHPACIGTVYEYPIMAGGALYNGGRSNTNPGPHRAIFKIVSGQVAGFCGLITHIGAPTPGGFVGCAPPF